MPNVNHNTLTGVELHEPKGIASATSNQTYVANGAGSGTWSEPEPKGAGSAAVDQVYISDGAGSGAWTYWPTGWEYIQDNTAQVFNTTPTLLSINGSGANSDNSYLPREIRASGALWNTSTDRIVPMSVGDSYELRLDLPVTAESGSPTELTIELDINSGSVHGSGIMIVSRFASTGKSTPYTLSVGFPVFIGSTFAANGGQFWLTADTGSVTVTDPGITIVRTSDGRL